MRRIAAIVLPELACEIARRDKLAKDAFAVIVDAEATSAEEVADPIEKTATLHAVSREAWRYGARPGQSASQAAAYVGQLNVVRLPKSSVLERLGAMAEIAKSYGTTAALALKLEKSQLPVRDEALAASLRYPLGAGAGPFDTVWLDVTGCAKLFGGEQELCAELCDRARDLGHRVRVAIADGPRIAQALARWGPSAQLVAGAGQSARALAELPIPALPLGPKMMTWLGKLGILRIHDLAKLDRKKLSHRLGGASRDLLEVIAGRDTVPLCPHHPPRKIEEGTSFEHEIESTEPLLFVLRGLASRAIARLSARGEACGSASILLGFDRAVIALKNETRKQPLEQEMTLTLDLPVPLSRESELMRALSAKLEMAELDAPVVSLSLVLDALTTKGEHQLQIGGRTGVDPTALPTLLAELNAHLGSERVGVLSLVDQHRPEARTRLVPVDDAMINGRTKAAALPARFIEGDLPTRILSRPMLIPTPERGALVVIDKRPFVIEGMRHTARIDRVDWWATDPVHRDYLRAWLKHDDHVCEAWVYVDRQTGKAYVHGWFE